MRASGRDQALAVLVEVVTNPANRARLAEALQATLLCARHDEQHDALVQWVRDLVEKAKTGDVAAAREVFQHALGLPPSRRDSGGRGGTNIEGATTIPSVVKG
jgi:hypothetical protein